MFVEDSGPGSDNPIDDFSSPPHPNAEQRAELWHGKLAGGLTSGTFDRASKERTRCSPLVYFRVVG
jgi:hypothetical protein